MRVATHFGVVEPSWFQTCKQAWLLLQYILCALAHPTITRKLPLILDQPRRPEIESAGKHGCSSGPAMHPVPLHGQSHGQIPGESLSLTQHLVCSRLKIVVCRDVAGRGGLDAVCIKTATAPGEQTFSSSRTRARPVRPMWSLKAAFRGSKAWMRAHSTYRRARSGTLQPAAAVESGLRHCQVLWQSHAMLLMTPVGASCQCCCIKQQQTSASQSAFSFGPWSLQHRHH